MARTHHVNAYRGKQKCQYVDQDGERCGMPRKGHSTMANGHAYDGGTLRCGACGEPIKIGDAYKFVKPRTHKGARGTKLNRHETCPSWKASELTSSEFRRIIYAAAEGAPGASGETPDEWTEALEALQDHYASAAKEAAECRQDAASNIEEGFGHETYQSEELRGEGDEAEQVGDTIEGIDVEWNGDDEPSREDFDENHDGLVEYEEAVDNWLSEVETWGEGVVAEIEAEWENMP
jgi:hypothetical protein